MTHAPSLPRTSNSAAQNSPEPPQHKASPLRRRRRPLHSRTAYLLILPALAIFGIFSLGPAVFTLIISTFDWNWLNVSQSEFIGPENYQDMLSGAGTPSFWHTLWVTAQFVGAIVVLGTVISLALAMLLRHATALSLFGRAAVFIAFVTPQVATSIAWIWMYNDRFGVLNAMLQMVGLPRIDWLGSPTYAMAAVVIYTLWQGMGFTMMIFLGGLTTISQELSQAAKVDGCNAFQEFWHVTLPQLRPFVLFVVIITSINSLQAFTQFFVMTSGGPGQSFATATLGFEVYRQAFVSRETGYAAALAVVLFAITAALAVAQFRMNRRINR